MPFDIFRRHQRKLIAVFGILAMFGFIVADSLPRLLSGSSGAGADPVVADLYGRRVRRSELNAVAAGRGNANQFLAELTALLYRRPYPQVFGDLSTRSLVDAMVLNHEADRLGMPGGPALARDWLKRQFGPNMTSAVFEVVLGRFEKRVSGEQILTDIADQIRLAHVRQLPGTAVVTPLDVFQAYRDQNERVSARAVGFRVEDFTGKVPEPTAPQVSAFYDQYKGALPDPDRPTPGFKVPRQVQVEVLSIDADALARSYQDKLTEPELQTYYENRKAEFKKPSELPDDLFQGAPALTPPAVRPFSEVRPYLATSLADDKAATEVGNRFIRLKEEQMGKFLDDYLAATDRQDEAKREGKTITVPLPKPSMLKADAEKEGLAYDLSPLLSRDQAANYGMIRNAEVGQTRMSGGRKFVEEVFDSKSSLYEAIELTDFANHRFLVRKLQDAPPRVPPLDEIRPAVVLAWKVAQARPLAQAAADAYAAKVKADGGKITGEVVEGRPVIRTDPVPKLQPGTPLPGQFFDSGPPTPSTLVQLPAAGPELRDAYFGLTDGAVAVAADLPKTVYYVLTLDQRKPALFSALYDVNGDYTRYAREALTAAGRDRQNSWMESLRAQAGLKPGWSPPDDARTSADRVAVND